MLDHHITYAYRRPENDLDANQLLQQEVFMLTPSYAAAVDVLKESQALPMEAHCIAPTRFAIFSLLDLLLLHRIRLHASWPSSLTGQVLPSSNDHALSCEGTQTSVAMGHNRVVFQYFKSCWQPAPPLRHRRPYHPKACFLFLYLTLS